MPRLRAVDRRRQLLEVAADLFARHGFHGTTTAQLAKSAGITEPILYRHFASKLDLFITLIDEVGDRVLRAYEDKILNVDDPAVRLELLVSQFPAIAHRRRGSYHVVLQAVTDPYLEPKIAKASRRHFDKLRSLLVEQCSDLQKVGLVRQDESAETLACFVVSVAVGASFLSTDQIESTYELDVQRLLLKFLSGDSRSVGTDHTQ